MRGDEAWRWVSDCLIRRAKSLPHVFLAVFQIAFVVFLTMTGAHVVIVHVIHLIAVVFGIFAQATDVAFSNAPPISVRAFICLRLTVDALFAI